LNATDPGDETSRNYRYQYAYGVVLLVAAKRGLKPYVAIWCEHHEDFLAKRRDGMCDGYQIKTRRPERGAWKLSDGELIKSIGRFVDLVMEFGNQIGNLFFVSNTACDEVTPASRDDRRRGRCPRMFLENVRNCSTRADIESPFLRAFDELQSACGCESDLLLSVLRRVNIIQGPSRGEFDAAVSHEHLAKLDDCRSLTAEELDAFRDHLVGIVHRASSLQVTDPIRHLRPLIESQVDDPALTAKCLLVEETIVYRATSTASDFLFPGQPSLELGSGKSLAILEQKLQAGGLEEEADYMRSRALAAEYNLLEDATRRPEAYPNLLQQIEQRVLGEVHEAHLRARQGSHPYGPAMLIAVQDRLRQLAEEEGRALGGHPYECLLGIAALLTSECRIWWSPRFPINPEAA